MASEKDVRNSLWKFYTDDPQSYENPCFCCRQETINPQNFVVAHVVAVAKGGKRTVDNLRPCCHVCNSAMQTKNLLDYKEEKHRNFFVCYSHCCKNKAICGWFCDKHVDKMSENYKGMFDNIKEAQKKRKKWNVSEDSSIQPAPSKPTIQKPAVANIKCVATTSKPPDSQIRRIMEKKIIDLYVNKSSLPFSEVTKQHAILREIAEGALNLKIMTVFDICRVINLVIKEEILDVASIKSIIRLSLDNRYNGLSAGELEVLRNRVDNIYNKSQYQVLDVFLEFTKKTTWDPWHPREISYRQMSEILEKLFPE
ncbi:MAG: HNH endonuclease [Nitrososphaerales archaeon]